MLLTDWLTRLSAAVAPLWEARPHAALRPAVVPTWSGAPGDVRRPVGRRGRRRGAAPAAPPEHRWGPRQRLA